MSFDRSGRTSSSPRVSSPLLFKTAAVVALAFAANTAYAQSDAQVYESAIAEAIAAVTAENAAAWFEHCGYGLH